MLDTDLFDPAELTGYARAEQEILEQGSLARYLPNREVADIAVSFTVGANGLVPEARYRAYDAEPEIGSGPGGGEVMIKLPAISRNEPISEYHQLRLRNASDQALRDAILAAMRRSVRAIVDRSERTRGVALATGRATVDQSNFRFDDDFGRDPSLTTVAASLWTDPSVDRLEYLETLRALYVSVAGVEPGAIVMSRAVFSALARGEQFRTVLPGGASRPAVESDVRQVVVSSGLPDVDIYNRSTFSGAVLPQDSLLMLPAPVDPSNADGTQLGATFWGQTLTAMSPEFGIEESEQPGIVTGVYRGQKVPQIAEVLADSISLPVLANANLSLVAKVI